MTSPTSSTEKTLFRYGRALEETDFATISTIMDQAAGDPWLAAQLLELDAAYQAELNAEQAAFEPRTASHRISYHKESPMIFTRSAMRFNGKLPTVSIPTKRLFSFAVIVRAAVLIMVLAAILLAIQPRPPDSSITTTLIQPESDGLFPPDGYPVIVPDNADQLTQIALWGEGAITDALWSPDGTMIAAVGYGIRWLDAVTLTEIAEFRTGTFITDAAFSPNGTFLATGCYDGSLRVYEVATGIEIQRVRAFEGMISSIAYSPDGTLIATGSAWGDDHRVRVWEVATGREYLTLFGLPDQVHDLAFSPDGTLLVGAGIPDFYSLRDQLDHAYYGVVIWDTTTTEQVMRLGSPERQIESLHFVPNSNVLLASSWDGKVYEWPIHDIGQIERTPTRTWPENPTGRLSQLGASAISEDGSLVATLALDGMLSLLRDGQVQTAIQLNEEQYIATLSELVSFNPAGDRILLRGFPYGQLQVLAIDENLAPMRLIQTKIGDATVTTLAISHQNELIATGGEGEVRVWDTVTGKPVIINELEKWHINALDFSQGENTLIVSGMADYSQGLLSLWEPDAELIELPQAEDVSHIYYGATFDASGEHVFTLSGDARIQMWDVATRASISDYRELSILDRRLIGMVPHPAGELVVF